MLIEQIHEPADLRKLNIKQLRQLCGELRAEIINVVSEHGGHLASNLGAVELTVAIHYVFDTPVDKLVFDVGHQSYAHKPSRTKANTTRLRRAMPPRPYPPPLAWPGPGTSCGGTTRSWPWWATEP